VGGPLQPVELVDDAGRRVRLLKPLGKGGFGSVWLAEVHASSGLVHRMAVKLMHEELMQDEELVARARDEARLMSQLNHDHVVKVHALTRLSGRSAVLMEYVEGIDCTALLAAARKEGEPGLPLPIALGITERAASALHAAWTTVSPQTGRPLRVVHRDIKPSNLLVSVSGAVKVMDFGVARAEFDREAHTESVQYGTQRYMAPERWLHSEAGPASDVFSLGVTLWELLAGTRFERLPLAEDHYNDKRRGQLEDLERHTPADPRTLGRIQELLGGMLAFDPGDRPAASAVEDSCGRILEAAQGPDLRRWARRHVPPLVDARQDRLGGDRDLVALTGTLSQHVTPQETAATPPAGTPTLAPEPPSRTPVYLAVVFAAALVLGIGGFALSRLLPPAPDEVPAADVEEPEVEEAEAEAPEVEAPEEEPVVEAAPRRTPSRAKVEPEAEPVAEPVAEEAPTVVITERPPPAAEFTWIKITADPRDGTVTRNGAPVPAYEEVQYEVGSTVRLTFTWPDQQAVTCEKEITADLMRIKFDKAKQACTYS